jgi:hypothetical protein
VATLERALQELYGSFRLTTKQKKVVKLAPVVSATLILLLILSGLIIVTARSLFETSNTISSVGTLKAIGVEVYTDEKLTNPATFINWGYLLPGAKKTSTLYIKNEGNAPLTVYLSTKNWSPPTASNYLTLTWSFSNGQKIDPDKFVEVTLTLTVSEGITGITSFNFDLIAEGSG